MNILINIDNEPSISLGQLQKYTCIASLIFTFSVDNFFEEKIKRISNYLPILSKYPTITTDLKITKIQPTALNNYSTVALGGTFDYLHIGHQILLLYSVLAAKETVYIGVTGDSMLMKKKNKEAIQSLTVRMKKVQLFVKSINPKLEYIIFELKDPFGPTLTEPKIECLVTSPETAPSISIMNQARQQNNLKNLQLIVCPLLSPSEAVQYKLSSSGIRQFLFTKNNMNSEKMQEYMKFYNDLILSLNSYTGVKEEDKQLALTWWNRIWIKYSEHWRFYHTNQHIYTIFKNWNSQQYKKIKEQLKDNQKLMVEIALFFHDIVYDTTSKTNEKDSAKITSEFIEDFFKDHKEKEEFNMVVCQLILQTEKHVPSSKLSQIVYDLDMGILNSSFNEYKQYARKIKNEYEPIVKDKYSEKRIQFLQKTLKEKLHFSFEPENLKDNLEWELTCLEHDDL